jgi:hypothetical protein
MKKYEEYQLTTNEILLQEELLNPVEQLMD